MCKSLSNNTTIAFIMDTSNLCNEVATQITFYVNTDGLFSHMLLKFEFQDYKL